MSETTKNPVAVVLSQNRKLIEASLEGATIGYEKFATAFLTAAAEKPGIVEVASRNPLAVKVAILKAAQLGLNPSPVANHFAFIPYGDTIDAQPQYQGYVHLMMESGEVQDYGGDVVYEGEQPDSEGWLDEQGIPRHIKDPFAPERDDKDLIGAYAWIKVRGADKAISVTLSRDQIEKRRKAGKSGNSPAWKNWYPEMCKAKAWKALGKVPGVPLSPRARSAFAADDEELKPAEVREVEPIDPERAPTIAMEPEPDGRRFRADDHVQEIIETPHDDVGDGLRIGQIHVQDETPQMASVEDCWVATRKDGAQVVRQLGDDGDWCGVSTSTREAVLARVPAEVERDG